MTDIPRDEVVVQSAALGRFIQAIRGRFRLGGRPNRSIVAMFGGTIDLLEVLHADAIGEPR